MQDCYFLANSAVRSSIKKFSESYFFQLVVYRDSSFKAILTSILLTILRLGTEAGCIAFKHNHKQKHKHKHNHNTITNTRSNESRLQ